MNIRYLILSLIAAAPLMLSAAACGDGNTYKTPEWIFDDEDDEDEGGDDPSGDPSKDPADSTGKQDPPENGKRFYLWVDSGANFPDFANSRDNIVRDLTLASNAGFTDIVVEVRPTTGDVLFKTDRATQVEFLGAWVGGSYKKITRTATWDYLQAFIEEGHKLGLRIHAGMNTMVGGNMTSLGKVGMLFRDASKKEWATYYNTQSGIVNALDGGGDNTKFLNPAHPDVVAFLVGLVEDLAAYDDLDGIILDRCRYVGLETDFSDISRDQFEEYLGGVSIPSWPSDVLPAGATYNTVTASGFSYPKYYKKWLEWRCKVIHDFIEKASDAAHAKHPDIEFGVYVGGWYSQYFDVGVNWASPKYNAASSYAWASSNYKNYGYADHCDQILIGAYANPSSVYGSWEWSMQGFCALAHQKIGTACPVVCGGPDVGNWDTTGKTASDLQNAVKSSVKACADECDGWFCFDMIHLKQNDYWNYVRAGINLAKE